MCDDKRTIFPGVSDELFYRTIQVYVEMDFPDEVEEVADIVVAEDSQKCQ
jgi:hypothetical protein